MEKKTACVITMVKDDYYFLDLWVRYYGEIFGRDSLYVINHGGDPEINRIAEGCNVMCLPGVFDENFDMVRWRLFNGLGNGLRGYYNHVIIGDVDEFLVLDPKGNIGLTEFLDKRNKKMTITPIGLEVVHRPELEQDPIQEHILGPRRYVRFTSAYSKPCIFNRPTNLSRGGHYSMDPNLKVFRKLYLFHMRYADAALYLQTKANRHAQVEEVKEEGLPVNNISWQWQKDGTKQDPYEMVLEHPIIDNFDIDDDVESMVDSWEPRENGLYAFKRNIGQKLYTLPPRFFGVI